MSTIYPTNKLIVELYALAESAKAMRVVLDGDERCAGVERAFRAAAKLLETAVVEEAQMRERAKPFEVDPITGHRLGQHVGTGITPEMQQTVDWLNNTGTEQPLA